MNLPYQTILDGAASGVFWEYVKYFLFLVSPLVMIWVAVRLVEWIAIIVRGSMENADDDHYYEKRRRHDDDYY